MMLALCHITFVAKGLQAVLRPKTPDYSAPGENVEINRISLAPTINECIRGLGNNQTKRLKDILFKFNYTEIIPSTISAFEMVNYWLDEKTVELA